MFENLFWTFILFSHIFNHFAENIMKTLSDDVKDDFVDLAETDELADSISKHAIVRVSWFESATHAHVRTLNGMFKIYAFLPET